MSLSRDGSVLFFTARSTADGPLLPWAIDLRGGSPRQFSSTVSVQGAFRVSPDGRWVFIQMVDRRSRTPEVRVFPFAGGEPVRRLTMPFGRMEWTPDGQLAYRKPEAPSNIWLQPLAGGSPRQLTQFADRRIAAFAWSPDGKQLAVTRTNTTTDIVLLKSKGSSELAGLPSVARFRVR